MTSHQYFLAAMLMGASLQAWALDPQSEPAHGMVVIPLAATSADAPTEERQPAQRLRDALRLPMADVDSASKPYRLSPEERLRLREQLRGQIEQAAHDNREK